MMVPDIALVFGLVPTLSNLQSINSTNRDLYNLCAK